MLEFLRPIQDHSLRIMIPDEEQIEKAARTNSNNLSSSAEDEQAFSPIRRQFKAYNVIQRSGFQHTEYVQILTHLCRAEIFISLIFLIHGLSCPGFPKESAYQGTCHINVLSALVGLFTGGMGMGAVHRFRWHTMLVFWLIMCIISAVANLLAVITTGVWLDHLSKLKTRTGLVNGLSGLMLLGSVLVGVCFILTSVLICHYWASNSAKYQAVGRIAKKSRVLKRRTSRAGSGTDKQQMIRAHLGTGGRYATGAVQSTSSYQQMPDCAPSTSDSYYWNNQKNNNNNMLQNDLNRQQEIAQYEIV